MRRATLLAALLLALAWAPGAARAERPTVIAVAYPLAYFAERLAGGAAEIVLPVPEGRDPQFWRPGVEEIGAVQRADLILLNGAGFAGWTERASLPRARMVDTSRAFRDRLIPTEAVTHAHGPEGEHTHRGVASFTWLDMEQAVMQAEAVADALGRLLPSEAEAVEERLSALQADLRGLDEAMEGLGEAAGGRALLASHPRYQYLARAAGLEVESLDWEAGAAPDEAQLAAAAETPGPAVLILEAELPDGAGERVAALGLAPVVVPTLAAPPPEGDFVSALDRALASLAAALEATAPDG